MDEQLINDLKSKYEGRVTDALFERKLYNRDLAPVPALMVDPLFRTVPDLVISPTSTEEVSDIVSRADKANVPITPRAGGSTVYFNSVPVKSGIVVDLNRLRGIQSVDEKNLTVQVMAGTTFYELDELLSRRGLAVCSVPSSAPVATVGGWFNMMGHGIGSLKYGSLLSQVQDIEVVLPNGKIFHATEKTDPPLEWFAYSEGTLGIVCRFTLKIRPLTPMRHFVMKFENRDGMQKTLTGLESAEVTPYNLHYGDRTYQNGMCRLGMNPEFLKDTCSVGVDFEGSEEELKKAEEIVKRVVGPVQGGELLSDELAQEEWGERYKALRLKRGGPSQLGGEIWLPLKGLKPYLDDIDRLSASYHFDMMSYGEVVAPGSVTVMTMFYADESKTFDYIFNLGLVKKVHDVGRKYGGHPYGVGLWNSFYVRRIYDRPRLAELKSRKKRLDPKGIMNPGKLYGPPILLNSFNFAIGCSIFSNIQRMRRRGGNYGPRA